MDDVTFGHKRPGKGDAKMRILKVTHHGSTGAKSDIYDCRVGLDLGLVDMTTSRFTRYLVVYALVCEFH